MSIHDKVRSVILSNCVKPENRTIGMEEECILYTHENKRLPVNPGAEFSATDLVSIMNSNRGPNGVYTLEPGGQLEWSSPPFPDLNSLNAALDIHKQSLKKVVSDHNLDIISFGVEPNYNPDNIDLINQLKYQLMDLNMEKSGTMGKWMMRNTASVQINFDVTGSKEMEEMALVADCLQPVSAYLFANSPYKKGLPAGENNLRNIIWENTDNARCRNLIDHGISSSEGLIDRYIDYVLSVPGMFQLDRSGAVTSTRTSIGDRLQELDDSGIIRDEDIQAALHQIFTNVRLKHLVEVRGADRPPLGYEMAPVAFWTGILTVQSVRDEILHIVKKWSLNDRYTFNKAALALDASQAGPEGTLYGEWNQWVGDLALRGLRQRGLGEEKFFEGFYNAVMSKGPFSIQTQENAKTDNS